MSFEDAKPGDKLIRMIGGTIAMPVTVMQNKGGLIFAACEGAEGWPVEELWTFDAKTGVEEDAELEWGVKFGRTGSFLKRPD